MSDLLKGLLPLGRTTRNSYRLIIAGSLLTYLIALAWQNLGGALPRLVLMIGVEVIVIMATVRRLRDAGRSLWWTLLFFFPMSITLDLLRVQIGESTWHFLDLSAAITLIPIFIGLFASSQSVRIAGTRNLKFVLFPKPSEPRAPLL